MRIGIAMPTHLAAIIAADAVRHGHEPVFQCSSRTQLEAELSNAHPVSSPVPASVAPDVVIVAATAELLDDRLLATADARGIRLVTIAIDRRDRAAERLGLLPLAAGAEWSLVEAACVGTDAPIAGARGTVIAVWGPDGAPGRSTVAIAIAAVLADRGVVLVDADTRAASVAIALGLLDEAPGIAAACRLAAIGALEHDELERVSAILPGGDASARVLTGIARADRWPELSADRVGGVLEACRAWRAFTVVDVAASIERDEELLSDALGPRRAAATIATLESADVIVLVGAADPVGAARMIDAAAAIGDLTSAPMIPVVNRMRAGAIGGVDARRQLVGTLERFGGIRDPILVPLDQAAADRALRTALPITAAAPRSSATAALRRLGRIVLERVGADSAASASTRRGDQARR